MHNPRNQNNLLYDDLSNPQPPSQPSYFMPPPQNQAGPSFGIPSAILNDPNVAKLAVEYGANVAASSRHVLEENIDRYLAVSKLKYFFAVNTNYVAKKLGILLFPFYHKDWTLQYDKTHQPVPPKEDVNAPDLYIPLMAFITYILLAGVCLGTQDRFTPEQLGVIGSSACVWYILELIVVYGITYLFSLTTSLKAYEMFSYCAYKYVGIILCICGNLLFGTIGFVLSLCYVCLTIPYFLLKTLRLSVLTASDGGYGAPQYSNRKTYFLLFLCGIQPLLMIFLTYHLI